MSRLGVSLVAVGLLVAAPALAGCGGEAAGGGSGLPGATNDELTNVVAAVDAAHPENTWWPHVAEEITKGPLADVKIFTDYTAEVAADGAAIVALCDAFLSELKTNSGFVVVYGQVTTQSMKVDGSVETRTDDTHKLAEGAKNVEDGRLGECSALPYYDSVEDELRAMGVEVAPFNTKLESPDVVQNS